MTGTAVPRSAARDLIGGVETGGTKVVCAVADARDPGILLATTTIPTRSPEETLPAIVDFFRHPDVGGALVALGAASFGPLGLDPAEQDYGHITSTPKRGWAGVDLLGSLSSGLGPLPVGLVTDVSGAALAEGRSGAGRGVSNFAYVTVGTGVGAGIMVQGRLLSGSGYPEVAHLLVRRHPDDAFSGNCRFHGDCLEGLAAGPAVRERWGREGSDLTGEDADENRRFLSYYLGQLVATLAYTTGITRVVFGGGVAKTSGLLSAIELELPRLMGTPGENGTGAGLIDLVPPALGDEAGVRGALLLAADALADAQHRLPEHRLPERLDLDR